MKPLRLLASLLLLCIPVLTCCTVPVAKVPEQVSNPHGWLRGAVVHFTADKDFLPEERENITSACKDWARWTDKGITCTVSFDRDFYKDPFVGEVDDFSIVKITFDDAVRLFGERGLNMLGVCKTWYEPNGYRASIIMLVDDMLRLYEDPMQAYRSVAAHELGHAFGFVPGNFHHTCQGNKDDQCSGSRKDNLMNAVYNPGHSDWGQEDLRVCRALGLCK